LRKNCCGLLHTTQFVLMKIIHTPKAFNQRLWGNNTNYDIYSQIS